MHIKKDRNHNEIEGLFRAFGWVTIDTSRCHGVLLDFIAYKGNEHWYVEVKSGNKPLTPFEQKFFREHPERSICLRSREQAQEWLINRHDGTA
jgi:hypothetical protein